MDILVDFSKALFVALLSISAGVGMLAILSPRALAVVATYGNRVYGQGIQTRFDRRWYDIDTFVLAHGRLFGMMILTAATYVWLVSQYGPDAYPKSLLLVIVAVSLVTGIVSLSHMMQQSRAIKSHLAEANTDPLTGLANRRVFDVELARRLSQRQRLGTPLCLVTIDIDHFKTFNDTFGHPLGDAVLKRIANVLEETIRCMDIAARIGGDEFAILYPGVCMEEASLAAERIRSAIADAPLHFEGQDHAVTVCIGLAEAQADDDTHSLIKRSDSALYSAKEAGRNQCYQQGGSVPTVSLLG